MSKLEIKYTLSYELHRVKATLSELPWYIDNGYKVLYPEHLSESSTDEEIKEAVTKEYNDEEHNEYANHLDFKWNNFLPRLENLNIISPPILRDKYTVVITKYGTGGSYFVDESKIIINRLKRGKDEALGVLVHEIIHIGIEHLIEKYKISHWKKERLVDLIGEKLFPDLRNMQEITKEDVSSVDEAFNKYFPDIEAVTNAL